MKYASFLHELAKLYSNAVWRQIVDNYLYRNWAEYYVYHKQFSKSTGGENFNN